MNELDLIPIVKARIKAKYKSLFRYTQERGSSVNAAYAWMQGSNKFPEAVLNEFGIRRASAYFRIYTDERVLPGPMLKEIRAAIKDQYRTFAAYSRAKGIAVYTVQRWLTGQIEPDAKWLARHGFVRRNWIEIDNVRMD